jgi:hypothetical protein
MSEIDHPVQSTKTLVKALIVAMVIAAILFVTIVLPAEYNVDPTGIGQRLGLTVLAAEPTTDIYALSDEASLITLREDETTIVVPARDALEFKFQLEQFGTLTYEWSTDNGALYFDLHGEPQTDANGFFVSYASATNSEMKGSITAPFAGAHGWFWRNSSNNDVTVSLKTQGNYNILGLR